MRVASIGVDWGGTWLRIAGVDPKGRRVFSEKRPSPSRSRLVAVLGSVLRRRKITDLPVLVLGGKGIWKQAARREWARRLAPLARRVVATSDIEIAHAAAFGGKPGVLVLAGTGSIALGIDPKGRLARAGGLGPETGDEGSGYWIGTIYRERSDEKPKGVRETAALAALVFRQARRNDPVCRDIVREAQVHLAMLVEKVARSLWKKGAVPVSWAGGLMDDADFRKGVLKQVCLKAGLSIRSVTPRRDAASAAALYGLSFFKTKK